VSEITLSKIALHEMKTGQNMNMLPGARKEIGAACLFLVMVPVLIVVPAGSVYAQVGADSSAAREIQYVDPNAATGSSKATIAGNVPLAHTEQLLPLDENGQLVGEGNARAQTGRVLENLRLALSETGADLKDVLKVNVYAAQAEVVQKVQDHFAERFAGKAKPAVSFVVTALPRQGALVAMDAVAVAEPTETSRERAVYRADALGGVPRRGHVAVMPPRGKVYVSGQVAPGSLIEATRGTMESLHATLAYLGLSADDVVQVKGFMPDITRAARVEEVIASYYQEKPSPPVVLMEWTNAQYLSYLSTKGKEATPIEIELIAAPGTAHDVSAPAGRAISYVTPPNMTTPATYSRTSIVHRGNLLYTSGFYGDPSSKDAAGQVRDIFQTLERVLEEAGTDVDHLAKGTYYVTGPGASEALNEIRRDVYDPKRAPASAKMPVESVGKRGALVTIDMIGVVPE